MSTRPSTGALSTPRATPVGENHRGADIPGIVLAIKPNKPEDDGEHGVPDVPLPNVALPIARGQRGCLTKNPQSARPLVCGHEREADGTKQDERGDHGGQYDLSAWQLYAGRRCGLHVIGQ